MAKGASGLSGGGGSAITSQSLLALSDTQINDIDKNLTAQINLANQRLATIASQNPAWDMPKEYYDIQREKQDILDQQRIVIREKTRRKIATSSNASSKTFINSFGEATTRTITTQSYAQSQKKLSAQIMRLIGG